MDKPAAQDAVDSDHDDPGPDSPALSRSTRHRRILFTVFVKWVVTVALAASVYVVLWSYSSKAAMSSGTKREFNVIVTGLSIGLGLSTASSLKAMVRELRWWLLSLRQYSSKEVELILKSEHLSCMIQLGWISRDLIVWLFVLFWLFINLAAQIAVATIGLTYNVDSAENMAVTAPGMVYVPNLSSVGSIKDPENTKPELLRYFAHEHGLYAEHLRPGSDQNLPRPGTIDSMKRPNMFYSDHSTRCTYVFYESAPYNMTGAAPPDVRVATNRSIASITTCSSHRVLDDGAGWNMTITLDDGNETRIGPPNWNGLGQMLYMTDLEQLDLTTRWSIVKAFEASVTGFWYYQCNVSIEQTTNAVLEAHKLSAFVATLASAGIALQGYGAVFTATNRSRSRDQFQSYPFESFYGTPVQGNATVMGWHLSQFAVGVIASVAERNDFRLVPGMTPLETTTLKLFDWGFVHLNLGLIVGLQLLLAAGTAWIATRQRSWHAPR
ncbi:hypothetical protein JDV02_001389 [Purpureocillium takamizusanense]|uniref:Uncharacterized protein n=1 Tax=Purpureocillium takamizusanense TaxID=2060973 RepID=A0A9Q8V6J7_9HYPO|nr:uncharacterized protein JDV02_001389 [Purpureocillium takamizusanense]UNI14793.1 hypothetical protein JDV02_001389 [Purpureocillium takamizusanense]